MSLNVLVPCGSCRSSVQVPKNSWWTRCPSCNTFTVEPVENGFQYIVTTCDKNLFRMPIVTKEFICKCCKITHVVTNETVTLHCHPFKKAEAKPTPEQKREKEFNQELERMRLEKETAEKEVQKMKEEMEKMKNAMQLLKDESNTVECDKCHKKKVVEDWVDYCDCSAMLLKKLENGFRYVISNCPSKVYRLKAESTWFTCKCCSRERIIGGLLPERICGQEVYSGELSSTLIRQKDDKMKELAGKIMIKDDKIKELAVALEKERKAVEEAERATKSVEKALCAEIESLRKEIELLKNAEEKATEMNGAALAQLCAKVIDPLVSQIQAQQSHDVDKEELAQLKKRAEEAESSYLEQKAEMVSETARYQSEITQLKADYYSLFETNADIWAKVAEAETKCKYLEKQNESVTAMNETLKEINQMAINKINEMAESFIDPAIEKNKEKIEDVIDTQKARM